MQKDGKFGEETRAAWDLARKEWTEEFGRQTIHSVIGPDIRDVRLEMTDEEISREASSPEEEKKIRRAIDVYQNMCNYRYWRTRAFAEAEPEMAEAHRNFYESKLAYKNQDFATARNLALEGMTGFDKILKRPEYTDLLEENLLCEECLLGWRIWDDIYQITGEKAPDDYPLKWVVELKLPNENLMSEVKKQFDRLFSNR
jgi:hypothetical protein